MPSAPSSSAAAARSPALIRSHWRFTSPAVRASASPKTCGWRRTILEAIAACTSARSNTPASAASWAWSTTWSHRSPSSPGQLGRRAIGQGVIDLVGLLEEVLAQRLVGLFAVPGTAIREAQAGRDPGHRPWPGEGHLGREGRKVDRGRQRVGPERADRRPVGRPEPADRVVRRIEPADVVDRVGRSRARAAGKRRSGRGVAARGTQDRERDDQGRPRRLQRAREEPFCGDHLEPVGGIEPPAEPRLRDERVEHRVPRLADVEACECRIAFDDGGVLLGRVPVGERRRAELLELPALGRSNLLREDLEQVQALRPRRSRRTRSCRSRWRRSRRSGSSRAGPERSSRRHRRMPAV